MFKVHLLSALYVSPPPISKQKLFDNNITATLINFSEYLFSVPCRYPNYLVSCNLNLSEVQTSTLKRVGLVGLWFLFAVFWKTLGKVVIAFAVIKIGNRLGFAEPPKPRIYTRPNLPPPVHPPSSKTSDPDRIIYPRPNPLRTSLPKKQEPKPPRSPDLELSTSLGSFVLVEDPDKEKKDQKASPPSSSHDLSASHSFVMVNPDERRDPPLSHSVSSSWVIVDESQLQTPVPSQLGSFVLIDSYIGDSPG